MLSDIEVIEYLRIDLTAEELACDSCDAGSSGGLAEAVIATRKGPSRPRNVWLCRDCVVSLHDGGGDHGASVEPVQRFFGSPA